MGTYDTQGGGAISPDMQEPAISELEDKVLGLLEDAGIDTETNDTIVRLINRAERAKAVGEKPRMMVFCARCNESEPVENSCARQYGYI